MPGRVLFVNSEPFLTTEALAAGQCPSGHPLAEGRDVVKRGGTNGVTGTVYAFCRRCATSIRCMKGLHDLTDPAMCDSRGRCLPCQRAAKARYRVNVGAEKQKVRRAKQRAVVHQRTTSYMLDGWPPREVLDAVTPCGTADPNLFDAYDKTQERPSEFRTRARVAASYCWGCPVRDACNAWARERLVDFKEQRIAGGIYHGTMPGRPTRTLGDNGLPSVTPATVRPGAFAVRLTQKDVRRARCPHGHDITRHGVGVVRIGRSTWCRGCRPDMVPSSS